MTEERLEEIKDSIILQKIACKTNKEATKLIDEELELYNEVVRLRDILNKLTDYVSREEINSIGTPFTYTEIGKNIYNILKQNNLTIEQLTGIAND